MILQPNGLSLAYIGDAVYELKVREYFLKKQDEKVDALHQKVVEFTRAEGQAKAFGLIREFLTEEEISYFKRGRNAKSSRKSKSASIGEYKIATGLEALFGYLFLTNKTKRIDELMNYIMNNMAK
jgi:ribonuclease-3 family protein